MTHKPIASLLAVLGVTGCSAVFGMVGNIPISSNGFDPIGPTSTYSGVVALRDNGCLFLDEATVADDGGSVWVVWPRGATHESTGEDQSNVRLADGTKVNPGDRIEIVGELITRGELPEGDNPSSLWGQSAQFCLGQTKHAAEILRAETVTILDTAAQR